MNRKESNAVKVIVISDTHIPAACGSLPDTLLEKLKGADIIIHAGDFTELSVIDVLKKIAPLYAVAGNMDCNMVKRQFPAKRIIELASFKIGIAHGYGSPDNLVAYVKNLFKEDKLDCIIYGHSHIPKIDYIDDTLYFCPGSPTEKVFAPYNSFGILEIDEKITPTIVRL